MKFVMPFSGSRGDVTPGLALGLELAERGHDIVFGAPPNLLDFARSATSRCTRIEVVSFGPDTHELLTSELVRVRIKSNDPRVRLPALAELANHGWDSMTARLEEMTQHANAVVTGSLGQEMAFNSAQVNSIAFVALHYCPLRKNGIVPLTPGLKAPPFVNRALWAAAEALRWRSMRRRENEQRTHLGLPPTSDSLPVRSAAYGGVEIQAYDRTFFPGLAAEWGPLRPFVGFLEPSSSVAPHDQELERWLDAGPAPVYFGFGSMPVRDPDHLLQMIESTTARLGLRALVCAGWSDLDATGPVAAQHNPNIRIVPSVDHATVFPRCLAAVHHGGAGTTAASARAGIPTMVCWFSADQPFWGAAMRRTGAGTSVKFADLTEAVLQQGITDITAQPVRDSARALARSMTSPHQALTDAADLTEAAARRH